jgi:hypothetical protein
MRRQLSILILKKVLDMISSSNLLTEGLSMANKIDDRPALISY